MNADLKTVLQKLVDKLEFIEKDEYVRNLHKYVFSLWKSELQEAKKALEGNKEYVKLPENTVYVGGNKNPDMNIKDVDLFDVKQLEAFGKIEENYEKIRRGMADKVIVEENGGHRLVKIIPLEDQPLKDELEP